MLASHYRLSGTGSELEHETKGVIKGFCEALVFGRILKPDQINSTRSRNHFQHREISAFYDTVDEIYLENDPIDVSLKQRRVRGGNIESIIATKSLPFFFTLKLKKAEAATGGIRLRDRTKSHREQSAKSIRDQRTLTRERKKYT